MANAIDNSEDYIDSRDVMERIEELQDRVGTAEEPSDSPLDDDETEELAALLSLQEQAERYAPDWNYGATLIRESYLEDYARETAEDMHGNAIREAVWPFDCIDWAKAADSLRVDYTEVDFDGVTYLVR